MYSLWVISNKPERFNEIVRSLAPLPVSYFDGSGYSSFSGIVNACVTKCPTETVIIMSDKVLPKREHVEKTLQLLDKGYAFVALYRFAFFGFKKELMRRIGFMDENHVGGGYEDNDFYIRLIEGNLSMYVTHDVPYTAQPSSWIPDRARTYHYKKWQYNPETNVLARCLPEPELNYNLGPSVPCDFLPCRQYSYTPLQQVSEYFYLNIKSGV
jgi:hypothetical protein